MSIDIFFPLSFHFIHLGYGGEGVGLRGPEVASIFYSCYDGWLRREDAGFPRRWNEL